jgi:hypothetical protein
MPSSAILDVAIGVAFVYLFFSMICSVVNEGIAALLASRAKNLVTGIKSLFSESEVSAGEQFVQAIYQHGLVRGLYKDPPGKKQPDVLTLAQKKIHLNLPAYIPSRAFATALLDILAPSDGKTPHALGQIRESISKLPESTAANKALVSLSASTGEDLSEFQSKVEDWYNDSMERAASWYKRKTQMVLLGLGLVVAVGMNVDSIRIALTLWNNPAARQAAVDVAQKYVEKNPITASGQGDFKQLKDEAKTLASVSQTLPVPFGWQSEMEANADSFDNPSSHFGFWSKKIIGWFVTALALSLGAPFWFDMPNKFMMARSSVKPKGEKKDSK